MMLWFLLRDEARIANGWQSGLVTTTGQKKPAFAAFAKLPALRQLQLRRSCRRSTDGARGLEALLSSRVDADLAGNHQIHARPRIEGQRRAGNPRDQMSDAVDVAFVSGPRQKPRPDDESIAVLASG